MKLRVSLPQRETLCQLAARTPTSHLTEPPDRRDEERESQGGVGPRSFFSAKVQATKEASQDAHCPHRSGAKP